MQIDLLSRHDERAAVATLSAAFATYPLFPPLCPDPSRRPRVIEAFCRMLFRMSAEVGGAFATPCRSAVACALPPGSEWPYQWDYLRRVPHHCFGDCDGTAAGGFTCLVMISIVRGPGTWEFVHTGTFIS
jgi:hypothetical protein